MTEDRVIYEVAVPHDEQSMLDDTPEEYRVVIPTYAPVACVIHGRYGKRWHANVSARWLVRHLIERLGEVQQSEDDPEPHFGDSSDLE